MPHPSPPPARFDAGYYARHYGARNPVHTARQVALLARAVSGYAAWLGCPLRTALDVGAGTGAWRAALARERPRLRYRSVDASPHAAERYGHRQADISRWRARTRFDLVICQGVLQYLPDAAAARAIGNLAAMCGGLLYLEVLTRRDAAEVADPERSDLQVHARSGAWYRKRLRPRFRQVGAGLWVARAAGLPLWELEAAGP